jgi:hypothetical protein
MKEKETINSAESLVDELRTRPSIPQQAINSRLMTRLDYRKQTARKAATGSSTPLRSAQDDRFIVVQA